LILIGHAGSTLGMSKRLTSVNKKGVPTSLDDKGAADAFLGVGEKADYGFAMFNKDLFCDPCDIEILACSASLDGTTLRRLARKLKKATGCDLRAWAGEDVPVTDEQIMLPTTGETFKGAPARPKIIPTE
jgi:hypothetical protein